MALLKTLARLDKLIWSLIFGGLLGIVLGVSIQRRDDALAFLFIAGGLLAAALGALLVYLRSRLDDPSDSRRSGPP
jgi:hypothetical protein